MSKDTLTITDNRTGQSYEVPIEHGAIKALDLRKIKAGADDFGLMTYDPGYTNTAACKSRITFIDGDKGILNYRGYPIEQLAEKSTYLETAFLILEGELPGKKEYDTWAYNVTHHTMVHENIRELVNGFRYDAHPMGMLMSTVAALSTYYPEAKNIHDAEVRRRQIFRLIAKMPTLAALAYRHSEGTPFVMPDNDLSYAGNFLQMMFRMTEREYKVDPVLEQALEVLFILHADHEQNCSTAAMRAVGSLRGRPVLGHRRRHRRPLRPAARRGQRDGAADAEGDRLQGQDPAVHQGSEDQRRRGPADGLRPPRVQELRPAGQDHQGDGRPRLRGHGPQPARSTSRSSWSGSPSRTSTSSSASSTRTSTSTRGSSTSRWASRWTCSRCSSRSRAPRAGWRSGRRCSRTRTRRSRVPARSTSGPRPPRLRAPRQEGARPVPSFPMKKPLTR